MKVEAKKWLAKENEGSVKEVDKIILGTVQEMQDLKVGSEEYLNGCKSICALADGKQKLSGIKSQWVYIIGGITVPIIGSTAIGIMERTQIVDRFLMTFTKVRNACSFKFK